MPKGVSAGSLRWYDQPIDGVRKLSSLEQHALALLKLIRETERPSGFNVNTLLGELDVELERWADCNENRFSRAWLQEKFRMYTDWPDGLILPIPGSTVLELGCGTTNPLALLMVFVLLGATRGIGIDLDPIQNPLLAGGGVARCVSYMLAGPAAVAGRLAIPAGEVLRNAEGINLKRLREGDFAGGVGPRLEFRNDNAESLGFPDSSVDIVLSNSFLEHIPDVDQVIKEMARVTRPGGWGVHLIDGTDHLHYENAKLHPVDFLRLESDSPLIGGCNRVRPLEFLARFERHGFKVVGTNVWRQLEMPDSLVATFAKEFRTLPRETLAAAGAIAYVRRVEV